MKNFPLYALWSEEFQGYTNNRLPKANGKNLIKKGDYIYEIRIFGSFEDAAEDKQGMIDYLTNPEKEYRSKEGDLNLIKNLEIVKLS